MSGPAAGGRQHVLVVDDEVAVRDLLLSQLGAMGLSCRGAADGEQGLALIQEGPVPALVLSDIEMPRLSGLDLLRRLKALDGTIQVVMVTGVQDLATVRTCLQEGAYDYLVKPFELEDLANTVERALERSRLIRQNAQYRLHLERMVQEQTEEIRETRDMALLTLAKLAESRDSETGHHLERMAEYSRHLAEELRAGAYGPQVTPEFVEHLYKSSPLHDIGKVGIPDAILLKPGPLTAGEFAIMQTHTTIGGDTLRAVIEKFRPRTFLTMGMEIAYGHHERWNGSGYPGGRRGTEIPLAARIVALTDAYDCITSVRPYKPVFDHAEAVRRVVVDREKHFDPVLVDAFLRCQQGFLEIQRRLKDQPVLPRPFAGSP
jgi:putative two-component system response regulator